jgi:hypothetical protein
VPQIPPTFEPSYVVSPPCTQRGHNSQAPDTVYISGVWNLIVRANAPKVRCCRDKNGCSWASGLAIRAVAKPMMAEARY